MQGIHTPNTLAALGKSLSFFRPHHQELRRRLYWIIGSICLCSAIAYCFAERLTALCIAPLLTASTLIEKLVYTNLPEAFVAYLKIALFAGIIFSMPITLYQTWAFVAPGLKKKEKKVTLAVTFWASLLFTIGAGFAFFIVLPHLLKYFMGYASTGLTPLPKFNAYLGFVARMVIGFGLAFEIPFLMIMASGIGLISQNYFRNKRPYFYGAIIVLAFLLSAGDVMATILLFFPLLLLYEMGNIGMRFFQEFSK